MPSTTRRIIITGFAGIFLCWITRAFTNIGIAPANVCQDLGFLESSFASDVVQNSFVVGIALSCLTIFDISVDIVFLRQKLMFESSVLLGIRLSLLLPNATLHRIVSVEKNFFLVISLQLCQSIAAFGP